jgi:hypothetical protein
MPRLRPPGSVQTRARASKRRRRGRIAFSRARRQPCRVFHRGWRLRRLSAKSPLPSHARPGSHAGRESRNRRPTTGAGAVAEALHATWAVPCRMMAGGQHTWRWDRRNECQRCDACGLLGSPEPLEPEVVTPEVVTGHDNAAPGGCDGTRSAPGIVTTGCDAPHDAAATRQVVTGQVEAWLAGLGRLARGGVTTLEALSAIGLPPGRSSETSCGEALRALGWRAVQRRVGGRRERRYFPGSEAQP